MSGHILSCSLFLHVCMFEHLADSCLGPMSVHIYGQHCVCCLLHCIFCFACESIVSMWVHCAFEHDPCLCTSCHACWGLLPPGTSLMLSYWSGLYGIQLIIIRDFFVLRVCFFCARNLQISNRPRMDMTTLLHGDYNLIWWLSEAIKKIKK